VKRWQLRDTRFGLALLEGDDALDVLVDFLHVKERADVRNAIRVLHVAEDGTVAVTYRGQRLYAVPAAHEVR
jgi:hypothetical protein